MAYDLTAAANGTYRVLGGKQYIYNATSARWERVILAAPDATVTAIWDGKEDSAQVTAGQPVSVSVKWNQPVTTSQFTQAMVSLTGTGAAIQAGSFVQDSVDSSLYRFVFSFSGAVGQVSIPEGAVSVGGLSNLVTYSEAVPGAYLPYAAIDVVSKGSTTYPVYRFNDPNTGQAVRFFTTNMVGTAASAASNRRLQVFFANFSTAGVATSSFTTADIRRTPSGFFGVTPNLTSPLYTTLTGTTSAATTTNPRFAEMHFPTGTAVTTNTICQIGVNAASYVDGAINNVAVSPIYYGNFLTSTINIIASLTRIDGSNNAILRLYIDHFSALVSNVDISKITLTANGGTLSTPQIATTSLGYTDAGYGNLYVATYTAAAGTTNFTETVSIAAGLFTIPVGTATSINGLTVTVTPVGATTVPWASAKTSAAASAIHSVVRTPFVITGYPPSTDFNNTNISLTFNRPAFRRNGTPSYTISTGNYSSSGGTFYYGATLPTPAGGPTVTIAAAWPHMAANTTYYIEIPAGAYTDFNGNSSQALNFSVTTTNVGALTLAPTFQSGVNGNQPTFGVNRDPATTEVNASGSGGNWTLRTGSYSGTIIYQGVIPALSTTGDPETYLLTIPIGAVSASTTYYLTIPAGSYTDQWSVASDLVNYTFTTASAPAANHLIFTTDSTYTVPNFLTSITALCIGQGGYSDKPYYTCCGNTILEPESLSGTGGGGLSWRNNIPVTQGETLYITFGGNGGPSQGQSTGGVQIRRGSISGTILLAAEAALGNGGGSGSNATPPGLGGTNDTRNNGLSNVGGGNGGAGGTTSREITTGGGGGGGAGGYSGNGGAGGTASTTVGTSVTGSAAPTGGGGGGGASGRRGSSPSTSGIPGTVGNNTTGFAGGGVGIYGSGSSGTASSGSAGGAGSGGSGVTYDGGAGGAANYTDGPTRGAAVVRILWGAGRSFPSTNVSSASS